MRYLKQFLVCYLCPVRVYKTDKRWDKKLNDIIDNCKSFERRSPYTVLLNGIDIWVTNWPYAYGAPGLLTCLPKRKTALKLRMFIAEQEDGFIDHEKLEHERKVNKILKQTT